jgi:predicted nucleotidyltransferase component of viral defense system
MIPQAYIIEWSNHVPWQTNEQVELDLAISRALVEIFRDEQLAASLAFRGGTALHKLHMNPQPRFSEDIDLVQIRPEPIKETVQRLQLALAFLGESSVKPRRDGIQIIFRFESEFPPVQRIRLKVETNTREHFTVLGYSFFSFQVQSSWFNGACKLTTYRMEELLGTKLRALYQRRKGRDLFDLYWALTHGNNLKEGAILDCYREYMKVSHGIAPSRKEFILNLEAKMKEAEFLGDTAALLRPEIVYDPMEAYERIVGAIVEKI